MNQQKQMKGVGEKEVFLKVCQPTFKNTPKAMCPIALFSFVRVAFFSLQITYSPQHNPDEYLNFDLKQVLSNKKASHAKGYPPKQLTGAYGIAPRQTSKSQILFQSPRHQICG